MATELFDYYEERRTQISSLFEEIGFHSLADCRQFCVSKGLDPFKLARITQAECYDDAAWAYCLGCATAFKRGHSLVGDIAFDIGEALQAFCLPGSIASLREAGLGHGKFISYLLSSDTKTLALLLSYESFAASEASIGYLVNANKGRKDALRFVIVGLGKDSGYIVSRLNGFTYVENSFDRQKGVLKFLKRTKFSDGPRGLFTCYGVDDVQEALSILSSENVDALITCSFADRLRFTDATASLYRKHSQQSNRRFFCLATGGEIAKGESGECRVGGAGNFGLGDNMSNALSDAEVVSLSDSPDDSSAVGFVGMGNGAMFITTINCCLAVSARSVK